MSFLTRQRWILLLAAVLAIAIPEISYAQLDLKGKAVETLTNGVMKELDKKFAEMIAKESLSAAVKSNIVKNLSEMSRPIVKNFIDSATSGKLPNQAELVNSVMKDITPRVQELVKVALTDGGNLDAIAVPAGTAGSAPAAGQAPTTASALSAVKYDDEKDFTVEIIKDSNKARITKYAGKNTELKIPPSIGNHPVTEIGERAFVKKGLVSVAIPDSVIFIGNMAFAENQINTVSIGANVYIANNAFENSGNNYFSAEFYNNQGRKAGTYNLSWRLVSAAPVASASTTGASTTASTTQTTKAQKTAALAAPPESAVVFTGNGHKYEVIGKTTTWKKASDDCKKKGGYLATITSEEEQEFILDLLSKKGKKDSYWLGGYREGNKAIEGWKWETGEDFTYSNWMPGEPNNSGGNENRLMISRVIASFNYKSKKGQWNDSPQSDALGYICEWDAE